MPRDVNRCPSCGERVSPFAAGCALCGADLDPRRHTRSHRRPVLPRGRWSAGSHPAGGDVLAVLVLVLVTLFAPLIGLIVCGLRAYGEERGGRVAQRNIALALGAICLVFLLDPISQVDVLRRIGLP